jgi:hypothetical protein
VDEIYAWWADALTEQSRISRSWSVMNDGASRQAYQSDIALVFSERLQIDLPLPEREVLYNQQCRTC